MTRRLLLLAPLLALRALADPAGVGWVADGEIDGLRTPTDVAFRPDGSLAVADPSARAVTTFGPDGAARWTWSAGDGGAPLGLTIDGDTTWVVGHGRLVALDASGTAGVDVPLPVTATDVAVASAGALWVSAAPDDTLLRVDRSGAELQRIRLEGPRGLAADGAGGVWVTEAASGRLVHLDAAGAEVGTAGGWGLSAGQFLAPRGIARTAEGGWIVADSRQGIAVALGADGAFLHTVSNGDGAIAFAHPVGLDVAGDRLAVADAAAGHVALLRAGGPSEDDGRWPAEQWLFRPSTTRDADPSTTCRQCHDGTRSDALGVWDPGAHAHPTAVGLDAAIPPSVAVAEDGSLRCVSCHAMHTVDPSEHDDPAILRGAELASESPGPVRVQCLSCHADQWPSGEPGHPLGVDVPAGAGLDGDDGRIACETCHAAHGAPFDAMTVRRIDDGTLCLACHADHGPSRSHHPIGQAATPAAVAFIGELGGRLGPGDTLTCLSCHDPHGVDDRHLLRAEGTQSACTGCHEQRVGGGHDRNGCADCHGMHTSPTPDGAPRGCPSCHVDTTAHPLEGRGCAECHSPHDPAPAPCASCHEDIGARLAGGPHDASAVPVRGSSDPCGSCHAPHLGQRRYLVDPGSGNPAVGRCLTCHDGSTRAQVVRRWVHPSALLVVASVPAGVEPPFQGPDGEPAPAGQLGAITCATCHDSHAPGQRRDVVGTCAGCHGDEARGLFDAYHERAGSTP